MALTSRQRQKTKKCGQRNMACKQMFGKVERRMPSALVNDLKS